MKKWILIGLAALAVLGGIYFGSPYLAFNSFKDAALEADADKLEAKVDFPAVRESLKSQMNAMMMAKLENDPTMKNNPFSGLGAMLIPTMVEKVVDSYVTADGIAALMRGKKPNETAERVPTPDIEASGSFITWDRFRFRLQNKKTDQQGPSLIFERKGFASWKLVKIELPPELLNKDETSGTESIAADTDRPSEPAPVTDDTNEPSSAELGERLAAFDTPMTRQCMVSLNGQAIMSGTCSGRRRANEIVVSSEHDGCTITIDAEGNTGTATLYSYRDICYSNKDTEEMIDNDINYGSVKLINGCWIGRGLKACIKPSS